MNNQFLDIEHKEDALERIQSLLGVPSKFTYSAEEWNLMVQKINDLYNILKGSDLSYTFENNVEVVVLNLQVNDDSQITNVVQAINELPAFEVTANQLFIFRTISVIATNIGNGLSSMQKIYIEVKNWIFKPGKGNYGTGQTHITSNEIYLVSVLNSNSPNSMKFYLGDIGTDSVEEAVNSSGPYMVGNYNISIFRAIQDDIEKSWLYVGNKQKIGAGSSSTIADDFINLNNIPPTPGEDNNIAEDFYSSLFDDLYYIDDTNKENIVGSIGAHKFTLAYSLDDDQYYFISKLDNVENFENSIVYFPSIRKKYYLKNGEEYSGYIFFELPQEVADAYQQPQSRFQVWFNAEPAKTSTLQQLIIGESQSGMLQSPKVLADWMNEIVGNQDYDYVELFEEQL